MNPSPRLLVRCALLLVLLSLAACGNKGPLVRPAPAQPPAAAG